VEDNKIKEFFRGSAKITGEELADLLQVFFDKLQETNGRPSVTYADWKTYKKLMEK
jgi:hypothetical protein